MITIRPSQERGHAQFAWLNSYHTFSFGDYYDPKHMNFKTLRVINEDWVAPGQGFDMHPHKNMEIITYVIEGALEHKDSLGTGSIIRPGDIQRMSAGTGIFHSEFNPSPDQSVHLLQIWITPDKTGYPPSYEQKTFGDRLKPGQWILLASPDGRDDSVTLHQDVQLYVAQLTANQKINYDIAPGRHLWLQIVRGSLSLGNHKLNPGDGVAISDEKNITLTSLEPSEMLLFDLA